MTRTLTLEELGDEITTTAAHLSAATCRWLGLVAEFDEREGWAEWGCRSCAHWVSWRCSMAPGPAREHVRVARRLAELPAIRGAFATGELSYSKVRALTRVENIEREEELLDLARTATAAQLERIVRAYRGVTLAEAQRVHEDRFLSFSHEDDGSVVVRGRFTRDEGALLAQAVEAFLERDAPPGGDVPAGTPGAAVDVPAGTPEDTRDAGARRADALVLLADEALAAKADAAPSRSGGDRFQVVVHVDAATVRDDAGAGGAELANGEPLAAETARRICCDAAVVPLLEHDGRVLSVGRKTRAIPPALRRALQRRDGGCRFPGCTHHRWVDAHHVQHWAQGGETSLRNLVQLCRHHHRLVHEGGYTVERLPGDTFLFRRPDGRRLASVPRPRRGDHAHPATANRGLGLTITPETPVPGWSGERLDLPSAVDAVLAFAPPGPEPEPEPALTG